MTIHVFLGPSCPRAVAESILKAHYWPPAAAGDVQCLVEEGTTLPSAILLIDGFFHTRPAVFHKELLYALSRGVPVYGAASMGALRGAELNAFGMRGIGRIYEAYASGTIEDDDEVAVAHGPEEASYCVVSEALVNIRFALEDLCQSQQLRPQSQAMLFAAAQATYYPDRSWERLLTHTEKLSLDHEERVALEAVAKRRPDQKRKDAELALRSLAHKPLERFEPRFSFHRSSRWERLRECVQDASTQGTRPSDAFMNVIQEH